MISQDTLAMVASDGLGLAWFGILLAGFGALFVRCVFRCVELAYALAAYRGERPFGMTEWLGEDF